MTISSSAIDNLNDAAAAAQITQLFMDDLPFYRGAIEQGVNDANGPVFAFAAHKLRGGLVLFGAQSAAQVAERLESVGNDGDIKAARELLPVLKTELRDLRSHLVGVLEQKVAFIVRG